MVTATDMPSNEQITNKIRDLVAEIDITTSSFKDFFLLLSKEMGGVQLKPKKRFIKEALQEAYNELNNSEEEGSEEEQEDEEDSGSDDDGDTPRSKKSSGGGGLTQKKLISDELASLLGQGNMMARTDVVKELWVYIREHDLQNPKNKQEIILDKAMKQVFGCKMFTMFTLNKYIGAHIHPFKPVDLSSAPTVTRKRKGKKPASNAAPKKRKSGTQPPFRLSEALADVCGAEILPRPQVVKMLWKYIKANNLQNEDNKKEIICDEKLQKVMGVPKMTMFKMSSLISRHLIEKVDRSEYQHEESDKSDESEDE